MSDNSVLLCDIPDGGLFSVAGIEFIKFPLVNGKAVGVAKNSVFASKFGDDNNDLAESIVLQRLKDEILPRIIAEVGEENVLEFETDLTTLDGLKTYDYIISKISLPTLDFYRANVEIFDKYKLDSWWWLATAYSAPKHDSSHWVLCVSPSGIIINDNFNRASGVRPFCIFDSSIFVSSVN